MDRCEARSEVEPIPGDVEAVPERRHAKTARSMEPASAPPPATAAELAAVVAETYDRLVAVARRILVSDDDAQDAVQDAIASALRALPAFEGRSRLSTWLHRITVNAALMRRRSQRRLREESWAPDAGGPERAWDADGPAVLAERRESLELALRALGRLPASLRDVLVLRELEGLDTDEAARALGVTIGAVKTRLSRARSALRLAAASEEAAGRARAAA